MRFTLIPMTLALAFAASTATAHSYSCSIATNGSAPYSRAELASLLPAHQTHKISNGTAKWNRGAGRVTQDDLSRVKWEYTLAVTKQGGRPAKLSYTFIPANGKLIIRLIPGASQSKIRIPVDDFEFRFEIGSALVDGVPVHDRAAVPIRHISGQCQTL